MCQNKAKFILGLRSMKFEEARRECAGAVWQYGDKPSAVADKEVREGCSKILEV